MYATLVFDTEDIYYPPGYRIDDIPGWLAEIMTEEGIRGTFFVMGEKARSMLDRGRTDVLQAMARHDIGSHQQGNRHPLLPEVLQDKGWQDGVEAVRRYEDWVRKAHQEAFGRAPGSFSRHNSYFGAQHVAVAGERGLPYAYMVAQIPGSHQPLWYAGALTFPSAGGSSFGGFDMIYSRDDLFEQRLAELDAFVQQRLEEGREWIEVFGCHPVRVMSRGWLEHVALASGMTRSASDLGWHYGVKPREEEARAQANFRRLCQYLAGHPDLEVVGISEAARIYGAQPGHVSRDALIHYAGELVDKGEIVLHGAFSPAELTCALAESLLHHDAHGDLPEQIERRDVLGPGQRPVVAVEVDMVTHDGLVALCRQAAAAAAEEGALPANLRAPGGRVGISQFALLAARSYRALAGYEQYARLRVLPIPRYPRLALELDAWVRRSLGEHWALPLDFTCERLAEHARLQTWTMKPAWTHPPQGPVADGEPYGARVLQV